MGNESIHYPQFTLRPIFSIPTMTLYNHTPGYTGRFAPSPSGQLHFGSLLAALASYLDARAQNGQWLVRMEDIDTPRCIDGADSEILQALDVHGLEWDGEVLYQSQQHERYRSVVDGMIASGQAYYCICTRKQIRATGGAYTGTCRDRKLTSEDAAIRLRMLSPLTDFNDLILGPQHIDDPHALEDTIIRRRDGLYAYNLVVVLDDIYQGVSHIIRGADLLPTTVTHLSLYKILEHQAPVYGHIPVASTAPGRKLSKQNHAAPLNLSTATENLRKALRFLGVSNEDVLSQSSVSGLLSAAKAQWDCKNLPKKSEIIVDSSESTYHTQPQ